LAVVENIIYMIACGLGIYCIVSIGRVSIGFVIIKAYGENPFLDEPVANNTQEEAANANHGIGTGLGAFAKKIGGRGARDRSDDEI